MTTHTESDIGKTRQQHLEWCKKRARAYLDAGDWQQAFTSFYSDMSKHPETSNHDPGGLGTQLLLTNNLSTIPEMRSWIEGFN